MSIRTQLMRNERHRWSYMTDQQLRMRLAKITRTAKLECFIEMAEERGHSDLRRRAINRAEHLGFRVRETISGRVRVLSERQPDVVRHETEDRPRIPLDEPRPRDHVDEPLPTSRLPDTAQVVNEEYDSLLNLEGPSIIEEEVRAMKEEARRQKGVRKIRFRSRDDEPHQPKLVDID